MKIDLRNNSSQLRTSNDVDIGFGALKAILTSASDLQKMAFRSDCQLFISTILQKLIERCPLKYKLVRGLSALQPSTICASITIAEERFNICLKMLYEVNHISSTVADNAHDQFTTLLNIRSFKKAAASFDELSDRLDDFWFIWAMKKSFNDSTFVIKMLLILSHGNATVESGFSINEDLLVGNLRTQSI
uniref:Uncharacterized protein n=1 Tax=Romanomermis culicivorax TaxID=13658 RepID=A0A915HYV5_ROMCU